MARPRLRMTLFGRFVVFLLIVGPLAFYGSHFLNTTEQGQSIKEWFKQQQEGDSQSDLDEVYIPTAQDSVKMLLEQVKELESELEEKDNTIELLNQKLEAQTLLDSLSTTDSLDTIVEQPIESE